MNSSVSSNHETINKELLCCPPQEDSFAGGCINILSKVRFQMNDLLFYYINCGG